MSGLIYRTERRKNTVWVWLDKPGLVGEYAARKFAGRYLKDGEFLKLRERSGLKFYVFTVVS